MRRGTDSGSTPTRRGLLSSIWLLVAIPLASAAVLLLLGRRADRWGHWLGVAAIGAAFVLGLASFFQLRGLDGTRSVELSLWDFIAVGDLQVDFGLLFDPLAGVFVLLITGVGFLIHLYAVGLHGARRGPAPVLRRTSTCSSRRCCCWCSATTT